MKRYLTLFLLAVLVLALGPIVGCGVSEPGLPDDEKMVWYVGGEMAGYSWGYYGAARENWPVYWLTPDDFSEAHKQLYIPKGYLSAEDFADAHFTDGTPYNKKQKREAAEAHNWGFYWGFCDGVDDYLDGKPDRYGY